MSTSPNFQPAACRFWCILQLCVVFSVVCWNAGYPFLGSLYHFRSQTFLYQYVLGEGEHVQRTLTPDLLARQKMRFSLLPKSVQQEIMTSYRHLQQTSECHWSDKCRESVEIILWKMAPLLRLWLVLGAALAIMLLLHVAGAPQAVWLLPLAAIAYSVDNHLYSPIVPPSADYALYPTENDIVETYLQNPLSSGISQQQEQLTLAWQRYIVDQWSSLPPAAESEDFAMRLEDGEYRFTLARLQSLIEQPQATHWRYRHSNLMLFCFMAWSLLFAWRCSTLVRSRDKSSLALATHYM